MTTKAQLIAACEKHGWPKPTIDAYGRGVVAVPLSDVKVNTSAPRDGRPVASAPRATSTQFRAWIAQRGIGDGEPTKIAEAINAKLNTRYDRTVIWKWLNPKSRAAAGRGLPPIVSALILKELAS